MKTFKEITENMSFNELYDYLWTCPTDNDGFTWYKIGLLMGEIEVGELQNENVKGNDYRFTVHGIPYAL